MNVDTGQIRQTDKPDVHEVEILMNRATRRQKREMRVSLHDHRSPLGKQLTEERAKRGLTRRQYRTLRKKGILR